MAKGSKTRARMGWLMLGLAGMMPLAALCPPALAAPARASDGFDGLAAGTSQAGAGPTGAGISTSSTGTPSSEGWR